MNGNELAIAGWKEWVALPDLGFDWIKAKLDTGARSCALHATAITVIERGTGPVVSFATQPWQRSDRDAVTVELPLVDVRQVRSSTGHTQQRVVVATQLVLGAISFPIELTLTDRASMGLRMLVGREALSGRVLVDSGRTYATRTAPHDVRRRNRSIA